MHEDRKSFDRPGTQFVTALPELENALETTRKWMLIQAPEKYAYRSVSWYEMRETNKVISAWMSSGQTQPTPVFDPSAARAIIFNFGQAGSDIRAFRAAWSLTVLELIETALPKLQQKKLSIGFAMLRGLIERMATANSLVEKVTPIFQKPATSIQEGFNRVIEASEPIRIALHGTKVDWRLLAQSDFETLSPKSAKYKPLEYQTNVAAQSIMNAVDSLNNRIPGTRVVYNVFCEFLHPNIGDLLAATASARPLEDRFGTRHVEVMMGRGPADLSRTPDIDRVFAESLRVVSKLVMQFPAVHRELTQLCDIVSLRTRKALRPLLKREKHLFRKDDLCPCHSGKTVGACCLAIRLR